MIAGIRILIFLFIPISQASSLRNEGKILFASTEDHKLPLNSTLVTFSTIPETSLNYSDFFVEFCEENECHQMLPVVSGDLSVSIMGDMLIVCSDGVCQDREIDDV